MPALPDDVERLSAELRRVFADAWEFVVAEQQRIADDPARFRRRARLRELATAIEARMGEVEGFAQQWLSGQYPLIYRAGGEAAAQVVGSAFRWTRSDLSAITTLAQDTFAEVLAATSHVSDTTKALVRVLARQEALLASAAEGTSKTAARRLERLLRQRGVHAVTYRNGARVGLRSYTDMLIRTKTAVAYNAGTLGMSQRAGVLYMEVFDGEGCGWVSHNDGDIANGTIRTLEECAVAPIAHPKCLRSFGPRPDLTTPETAERAGLLGGRERAVAP